MKYIRDITWEEVYENWKENEEKDDIWKDYYDRKGFDSWDDFRKEQIDEIDAPNLKWELYEIFADEIKEYNCGDFKGWLKIAKDVKSRKFKDLAEHEFFQDHKKIEIIKKDFPEETQIVGLKKGGEIYIFEGNHRAVAIAELQKELDFNKTIYLALAEV
ncbi:MAG: hypothetical protein ABH835_03280 [Patescibacteria group bacterium]|nr:hypothetical protein [Patescibacteria group bacterium]